MHNKSACTYINTLLAKYHSTKGPLPVTDLPFSTILSDAVLEAAKTQGFKVRNVNAEHSTGTRTILQSSRLWH